MTFWAWRAVFLHRVGGNVQHSGCSSLEGGPQKLDRGKKGKYKKEKEGKGKREKEEKGRKKEEKGRKRGGSASFFYFFHIFFPFRFLPLFLLPFLNIVFSF